jgi:hypothetical protein
VQGALTLLDAATSTGVGTAFGLGGAYSAFGVQYRRAAATSTGSTSASVQLQGSLDGTNYVSIGAAVTVNSTAWTLARSTNAVPVTHVRLNLASFTTGNEDPAITVYGSVGLGSS